MTDPEPVISLEGPHLRVVDGPDRQVLLVNLDTRDYLKVSGRGYDLLLRSAGLTIGRALTDAGSRECIPADRLQDFFDKIVRLGFIVARSSEKSAGCVREIWFHVTDRCNLSCSMCYFEANERKAGSRLLNIAEWQRAAEACSRAGALLAVVSGGEPLLYPDLPELLAALKGHGLRIWLLTNGTLLTKEACVGLARYVDRVSVSLDGTTAAAHEKMRGPGTFEAAVRGIRLLKDAGLPNVGIIPTIRRDNLAEVFKLDSFARNLGATVDSRCLFTARGSATRCRQEYEISVEELLHASTEEMRRRMNDSGYCSDPSAGAHTLIDGAQPQLNACGAGRRKLSINVDGNLYPCQLLHEEQFLLGNILDVGDLNELVCGGRARHVTRFTADRIDNVGACRSCDVRYFCGGGCVVSNVADHLPLDSCPAYCQAAKNAYRVAVWEWRSNLSPAKNQARILEILGRQDASGQN